jgi:hypothetical protein
MHFDPRTQAALRAVGLDEDDLRRASDRVAEAVREDARALSAFFDRHDAVYSDMDLAHSDATVQEHVVESLDTYTHGADLRGYLRFDSWGVYVEGGRVLDGGQGAADGEGAGGDRVVELTLGPTVHDRVRFAPDREAL